MDGKRGMGVCVRVVARRERARDARLVPRVVALVTEGRLVRVHEEAVKGQERALRDAG